MRKTAATLVLVLSIAMSLAGCSPSVTTTAAATTSAPTAAATTTQVSSAGDNAELNGVYAANYTRIASKYTVNADEIGMVLYAAEGTAADGTKVVAMKVRSARHFNSNGFTSTGWDDAEPGAYTMAIVINKATNKVAAWKVLVDGTRKKEYFTVPEKSIDKYMDVAITSESAFDAFRDGLVLELDVDFDKSSEGSTIIAGTSIVYSGASEDGSLSGQLVRLCFRTAANYYSNYAKSAA